MNSAPFSFSIPMMLMMFVGVIIGAITGALLGDSSMNPYLAAFLCGFLPLPVLSVLRVILAKLMASNAGVTGDVPYAWSWSIRYMICAVVAALTAFIFVKWCPADLDALTGAMIAVITSTVVSTIMVTRVSTKNIETEDA